MAVAGHRELKATLPAVSVGDRRLAPPFEPWKPRASPHGRRRAHTESGGEVLLHRERDLAFGRLAL